jgi:tetratricopeptide (TPR) repeat protein
LEEIKKHEYDCFISYCDKNHGAAAEALYLLLRLMGVKAWLDEAEFIRGNPRKDTGSRTKLCRELVVMYSQGWEDREACIKEYQDFKEHSPCKEPLAIMFDREEPSKWFSHEYFYNLAESPNWWKLLRALNVDEKLVEMLIDLRMKPSSKSPFEELFSKAEQHTKLIEEKEREIERLHKHISSNDEQKEQSANELKEMRKLLERLTADGKAVSKEDLTQQEQKDIEKAAPAYVATKPNSKKRSLTDLVAASMMEDYTGAISIAEEIESTTAEKPSLYFYWGNAFLGLGKYEEACAKYVIALKHKPSFPEVLVNWGTALVKLGRNEEACGKYSEAARLRPKSYQVFNNWGNALTELDDFEEAFKKYKEAVNLKADYADAYYNWAISLGKLGRHADACAKYAEAERLNPDDYDIAANWGNALYRLGRFDEAYAKYAKAIELKPDLAEVYFNWGTALAEGGKHEEACEKFSKAVKIKTDHEDAYYNWGTMLLSLGRYQEACVKFAKAVEHKPDYYESYFNWGNALCRLALFNDAYEKVSISSQYRPNDCKILAAKGEMAFYCGLDSDAVLLLTSAVQADNNISAQGAPHIILAAALMKSGRKAESKRELQAQVDLEIGKFGVDWPSLVLAAFDEYKDDPEFAPLLANVRKKLKPECDDVNEETTTRENGL